MVLALALATVANASTSAEKQAAIDSGLAYLAGTQQVGGYWSYGGGYGDVAATGAALLAFTDQYYKPSGWKVDYSAKVTDAANYLINSAFTQSLLPANENGFSGGGGPVLPNTGLLWGNGEATYVTGIVASALSRLIYNPYGGSPLLNPNTVVGSGAAAGLTYAQVIQKAADSFIWGQTPSTAGNQYGGWRYVPNITNSSDNSTSQWGPIIFLFGQGVGVTVPPETKTGLAAWVKYIQNMDPGTPSLVGGAGYDGPYNLVNSAKTGGLLLEMAWIGGYTGGPNMDAALNYLNNNWLTTANSTWDGNFGHPYAMWAEYKGLESTIGLTDPDHKITNLLDPSQANWWEDYCQYLVETQNPDDGSWSGYSYWYGPLATSWYINILNGTRTEAVVPIPGSVALLGSGLLSLLGAGWWRRRKA